MRRPVVLIPGFLGTRLRNRVTRRIMWGNLRAMYGSVRRLRREGFHIVPGAQENPNAPDELFSGVTLIPGLIRHDFYRGFRRALEAEGYEVGRTLFLWAYDWRRSATALVASLGALLDRIGAPVHAVVHSTGGLILEYYLRYGALKQRPSGALQGEPAFETCDRFASCTWVGATLRGTAIAVRDLFQGYRPAPAGLRFPPAASVTFPSIFESFPFDGAALRSADGTPSDLYDASLWNRHGWPLTRRRDRRLLTRFHGPGFDLAAHVAEQLAAARRFHEALLRGPTWPPGIHRLVVNDKIPTQARIPLRLRRGVTAPAFPRYADDMADLFADGDMTATVESQLRGAPRAKLPPNVSIAKYDCRHRYLVSHPPVIRDLLSWIRG